MATVNATETRHHTWRLDRKMATAGKIIIANKTNKTQIKLATTSS
jgi:hypothetical protein